MSTLARYALVALVAAGSAAAGAKTVLALGGRPDLRAAKAEAPLLLRADAAPAQGGAVMKANDGHFWAQGEVNGRQVRFLVDTGATAVALTPEDAERLGIELANLQYGQKVVTAGGATRAASVKLASITVAGAKLENVDAVVIEKGLDASLLGMTYLGRLSGFHATRQALFLTP